MFRPLSDRELDGFAEHARKGKLERAAVAKEREHLSMAMDYIKHDADTYRRLEPTDDLAEGLGWPWDDPRLKAQRGSVK